MSIIPYNRTALKYFATTINIKNYLDYVLDYVTENMETNGQFEKSIKFIQHDGSGTSYFKIINFHDTIVTMNICHVHTACLLHGFGVPYYYTEYAIHDCFCEYPFYVEFVKNFNKRTQIQLYKYDFGRLSVTNYSHERNNNKLCTNTISFDDYAYDDFITVENIRIYRHHMFYERNCLKYNKLYDFYDWRCNIIQILKTRCCYPFNTYCIIYSPIFFRKIKETEHFLHFHNCLCEYQPYFDHCKKHELKRKIRLIMVSEELQNSYEPNNVFHQTLCNEYLVMKICSFL